MSIEYKKINAREYLAKSNEVLIARALMARGARPYVCRLWVSPSFRRQGIAIALVRFIIKDRGKFYRAPAAEKNAAIHALSAKLGDELFAEEA